MPTPVQSHVQTYNNFVDGEWVASRTGKLFENRNPANQDDLIGVFQESSVEDAEAAIAAAARARRGGTCPPPAALKSCCGPRRSSRSGRSSLPAT